MDAQIIKLLAQRSDCVKQAARFKKDEQDVKAVARVEQVIAKVRNLAVEAGLNPDIAEAVYRTMIECFVNFEMQEHNKIN